MLMGISPEQCRAARAMLKWSQTQLADAAQLGLSTVVDFERERRKTVSLEAVNAMQDALEKEGIFFLSDGIPAEGTGVSRRGSR